MKKIQVMVLLIVVALFMMGFIGGSTAGASGTSGASHAMGMDHSLLAFSHQFLIPGVAPGFDAFSVDNCLIALSLNQNSQANGFSYVHRARDLIDQNKNRNMILDYIVENPGSTQNEMVKALEMNIGTLRYHLMILTLNHRVVPYNDGPRLVRYFVNKGSYSQDQMMIISLLKRDPTSRLLDAMVGEQAMTGSQISAKSGLSYSDINRYLKELTAKGVVIKEAIGSDRYQYRLAPEYEDCIANSLEASR